MDNGQQQSITSLLTRLGKLLSAPPASVEIIPGDGSDWPAGCTGLDEDLRPFLLVEGNLGVPQKVLYKAFVAAVREFTPLRPTFHHILLAASEVDRLAHLSAVILLANPAHQTALNLRKKLVASGLLDAGVELQFCAALLVVRENAKQSLLWHHRRWLLRRVHLPSNNGTGTACTSWLCDTLRDVTLPAEALRSEFSIAAQACETYHRNYFAWTHRHLCLEALIHLARTPHPVQDSYQALLLGEMLSTRTWIERHISDYTAVHYFHSMHVLLCQEPTVPLPGSAAGELQVDRIDRGALCAAVYVHAQGLLEVYSEHESMWLYLRAAMDLCDSVPAMQPNAKSDSGQPLAPEQLSPLESTAFNHAERHQRWLLRRHRPVI